MHGHLNRRAFQQKFPAFQDIIQEQGDNLEIAFQFQRTYTVVNNGEQPLT